MTTIMLPYMHTLVVYYAARPNPATGPGDTVHTTTMYVETESADYRPTKEQVQAAFKASTAGITHNMIAWELLDTYTKATDDYWRWGQGPDFRRRRAAFLRAKEKGMVHTGDDRYSAVDEVHFLVNDPHKVEGIPTMFTSKSDAVFYAANHGLSTGDDNLKTVKVFIRSQGAMV